MSRSGRITGIDAQARQIIRDHGFTVREYLAQFSGDTTWPGDSCGCTDDRCRGHHHGEDESCGCLYALLEDLMRSENRR